MFAASDEVFAQSSEHSSLLARVGDSAITEADVDDWWRHHDPAAYQRLRRELYDGRRRALDGLLAERLVAVEASRRGLSVDALLEVETTRRARPVTGADVTAFLRNNPAPAGVAEGDVAPLVGALLRQRAREAAREDYLRSLRSDPEARVQVLLAPPRVAVGRAPYSPTRGPASAPVEVVVFSDFECPFCRRAAPALMQLGERFPTEVSLVWRHYPLAIHGRARAAAEAAQCAQDQGRFWAYHDALFSEPELLASDGLTEAARRLGLDTHAFAECVSAHAREADVSRDSKEGEQLGVSGTPTVFINGVAFVGALSYEVYERAVLEELAWKPVSSGSGGPGTGR